MFIFILFFPQLQTGNEIPFSFLTLGYLELSKIDQGQSDGDDVKNKK